MGRERSDQDALIAPNDKTLSAQAEAGRHLPHPRTLLEPVSTMAPTAGSAQMACVASSRSRMMPLQSAFRAC